MAMSQPTPVRIQRKRTAGFNMQAASMAVNGLPCISVARPGRWGNPYSVAIFGRELALRLFRNSVEGIWNGDCVQGLSLRLTAYDAHHNFRKRLGAHPLELIHGELGGHNLACFCSLSEACHADVLLEILRGVNHD
jgi:hypothetical protein